jgi:hypothetical protein
MWLSYGYLDLHKKNKSLSSWRRSIEYMQGFQSNVQYPHAINTTMTIHMQGGSKYPK